MRKICLIVAFLAGCIVILYTLNYETSVLLRERVGSISHAGCRNEGLSTVNNTLPRYIFGHSTGHSGSTTSHATLREARCCPWSLPSVSSFEKIFQFERPPPEDDDCTTTRTKLIPMLESLIGREPIATTYLDMGHYRNRGRTLECLAEHTRLGEAVSFTSAATGTPSPTASSTAAGSTLHAPWPWTLFMESPAVRPWPSVRTAGRRWAASTCRWPRTEFGCP